MTTGTEKVHRCRHTGTKVYAADFTIFGRRTRVAVKKTYTHAYAALRSPDDREWVTGYIIGFSGSRELAERQVRMRRNLGWTGPFEIVPTVVVDAEGP